MSGDTLISGTPYYRMMVKRADSTACWDGPFVKDTSIMEACFLREDSNNRVYQNIAGVDHLIWDFNIAVGDSFLNCRIGSIDTVWLGQIPLKRFHCNCFLNSIIIEGVGTSNGFDDKSDLCNFGIEYSNSLVCYSRQGNTIHVDSTQACQLDALPSAISEVPVLAPEIYPNPTNGRLYYRLNNGTGSLGVSITDVLGQQVYSSPSLSISGELDLSGLSSGVYFIRFTKGGQKYTQRIIKE
jgi:hypothetical protein